jgi:2EXR family
MLKMLSILCGGDEDYQRLPTDEDYQRLPTTSSLQPKGFAKLDLEIRLMIWRLAYTLQGPRIFEARTKKDGDRGNHQRWPAQCSPSPSHTIVNVCYEAREEARKWPRELVIFFLRPPPTHLVSFQS